MAQESIVFDKTEIAVMAVTPVPGQPGKTNVKMLHLTYDQITNIQFDKVTVRGLFGSKPSEKITLAVKGRANPVEIFKHKEGKFFEGYKTGLEKFAKDNRITFRNNLGEPAAD